MYLRKQKPHSGQFQICKNIHYCGEFCPIKKKKNKKIQKKLRSLKRKKNITFHSYRIIDFFLYKFFIFFIFYFCAFHCYFFKLSKLSISTSFWKDIKKKILWHTYNIFCHFWIFNPPSPKKIIGIRDDCFCLCPGWLNYRSRLQVCTYRY